MTTASRAIMGMASPSFAQETVLSQSTALVPMRPAFAARQQLCEQPGLPFAEQLPANLVHDTARRLGHIFRQRVARLLAYRTARGLPRCSPDTGAYCRARSRLPDALLQELTRHTGRQLHEQAPVAWLWKGRPVKVADGTGISMPDTKKNQKTYPKNGKLPAGVGFPVMRLVVVFSLAVGTVLEAAIGRFQGKGQGELSLFRPLLQQLQRGDVLLGDRLYGTYWNVAYAVTHGIDVVVRQHAGRAAVWFRGRGHRTDNRRVWWRKPQRPDWMSAAEYERIPHELRLRAVRVTVRQRGFRSRRLVLITTLTDAESVNGAELGDLYRRRWQAELYLRSLKQTMQMDILRGK